MLEEEEEEGRKVSSLERMMLVKLEDVRFGDREEEK